MTEQEIREKIANRLKQAKELREGVINILKQWEGTAFYPYSSSVLEANADQIHAIYKEAGYVRLAEDQRLPLSGPYSLREAELVRQARRDMLKAGWRKVEKEG